MIIWVNVLCVCEQLCLPCCGVCVWIRCVSHRKTVWICVHHDYCNKSCGNIWCILYDFILLIPKTFHLTWFPRAYPNPVRQEEKKIRSFLHFFFSQFYWRLSFHLFSNFFCGVLKLWLKMMKITHKRNDQLTGWSKPIFCSLWTSSICG